MEPRNIWTPAMRESFITRAVESTKEKGSNGQYWFNVLPKITRPDEENPKKAVATRVLMNTIFANPQYRIIALKIYDILVTKMVQHPFVREYFNKDIVVVLKGGTAYTYVVGDSNELFPYSDLDVIIYINPYLSNEMFYNLKETVKTIVLQTISQYKRAIDNMFFSGRERADDDPTMREWFLSGEVIKNFKNDLKTAMMAQSKEFNGILASPFENLEYRNMASRYSCVITKSRASPDSVVRVEIPHFNSCERIPLKKSPLFCSVNTTIDFNRSKNPDTFLKGSFDLYRLRLNNIFMHVLNDSNEGYMEEECNSVCGNESGSDGDERKMRRETVTADFIDVSIPNKDDAELLDFWNHGRTWVVRDRATNIWLTIPDMHTMRSDLYKMLHIYECPESKMEKRQKKYEAMCAMNVVMPVVDEY
jgi:predicted nucleotidyltransferase